MNAIKIILCGLTAAALSVDAAEFNKQLPVHVAGRVVQETIGENQTQYTYSWPGIYFEAEFKGTAVNVKLNDDQNILNIIVDDQAPIVLNKPGKITHSITKLANKKHRIRLEKLTETQWSKGTFEGFFVPSSAKVGTVEDRKHQIEFIGDSFTVGYGNISASRDCTTAQVYETTNSQLGFGPRVAKHFDADFQINASSGFGVVRNYNGTSPDKSLLKLYPYTLNDNSVLYNGKWSPQIIAIGLGTNDFSTQLNPGEKWATREALQKDYVENYKNFIKSLRAKNPNAYFILNASKDYNGEIQNQVEKIVADLKASGETKIDSIFFSGLEYGGCHWHPSVKDDETIAKLFIDKISANPGWWN